MKMYGIKQQIKDRLKHSTKAKARLAYEFDVNPKTIDRWLDGEGNAVILTTPLALTAIAEELDVKKAEILTELK
jgi:hypothetical protein